jgi:hypothetical protein
MELSKRFFSLLPMCLVVSPALAGTIEGHISAISGQSDNATKVNAQGLSERQDEYQLSLAVNYEKPLLVAEADYLASERHFAKESQDDKSYIDGKSSLYFGNMTLPADLLIKHSRRILLQEPDQLQLTNNLDERDITSIIPTLRASLGEVDILSLSADYTDVHYAKNELRDSSRSGGSLRWMHWFSNVDSLQLVGQRIDIEFDAQPQADYTYQNTFLAYTTNLRALTYSLQAGYNHSENEIQGEFDAPSYAVNMEYEKGTHKLNLLVTQQITDSSLGDGNSNSVDTIPGSDGAKQIQRLERMLVETRWTSSVLCVRCSIYLMFRNMDDDYITINESATQTTAGMGFSYQFSRAMQLALGAENSRRKFEENIISNSYEVNRVRMNVTYKVSNHLQVEMIGWQEDREKSEAREGYTENYIGMSLAYHF